MGPSGTVLRDMDVMSDFADARLRMVERQLVARGISDPCLLEAMSIVPRELFVAETLRGYAYEDSPLPIEAEQTISQPYIVALMIEAAAVKPGDRVLEIGAGSGYAAAIIGQIARTVVAIERHEELARIAAERMDALGYDNVSILHGDGSSGRSEDSPFDAILVAASGSHIPDVLTRQLADGGRLVMPIGEPHSIQRLIKVTRTGLDRFRQEDLGAVRFVPLIGEHAWRGGSTPEKD
jgi:protein-L-isoaspartate(D-aspartate) O-methyltransferase